jgi:anaerobic ribonucleoside-triphosphate reductase activating protein
MTPDEIAAYWRRSGGGLALSGGEPFSQAEGLTQLCRLVRAARPETPILVYTGYRLAELLAGNRADWLDLLRETDVLVDGPYIRERQTDLALAGSDNQQIFFLSRRVPKQRLAELPKAHVQAALTSDGELRIVGTGAVGGVDMNGLIERLQAQGLVLEE